MRTRASIIVNAVLLIVCLSSCATYYDKIIQFHSNLDAQDYTAAEKSLQTNKFIHRKRNRALFCLEAGKLYHLQHNFDSSNYYFNLADILMDEKNNIKNLAGEILINSAQTTYNGEDFEKVMLQYYKALNYFYLGKKEDAIVEARRMNLRLMDLGNKRGNEKRNYKNDAFGQWFMGVLYESNNDYNNAFIAYRNAADLYENNKNVYYGVVIPEQLKKDVIRTALYNGFSEQAREYQDKWGIHVDLPKKGQSELVVIWENGIAPVKQENDVFFTLAKNQFGAFSFISNDGYINIPFNWPSYSKGSNIKPSELGAFRIAFPKYVMQMPFYNQAFIKQDSVNYKLEMTEDLNIIAVEVLRDRLVKEAAIALSRLAIKKAAEYELRREKQEGLGAIVEIAGLIMEKADTRNWQSLPANIQFARIPLQEGENKLTLQLKGQTTDSIPLTVKSNGGLQIINLCNLKHYPAPLR